MMVAAATEPCQPIICAYLATVRVHSNSSYLGPKGANQPQLFCAGDQQSAISMPAKIGKTAASMPARLAAASAMPEARQPEQQDARQRAEEQPSLQLECSSSTLDFTAPMHGREQSRAVEGRPWAEAFFVEERHVITEPLHPGMHEDALQASSEASLHQQHILEEPCSSNSLSAMEEQRRLPGGRHVLDQLEQDSEGDLPAALKAAAACTPVASWQRAGELQPLHLDAAGALAAASDPAGPDVIPDTVQKQDAALHERPEGGHEVHSSSKRQDPASGHHRIPDSLDDNDYHLQPPSAVKGLRDIR